jgi:hypothetical protein
MSSHQLAGLMKWARRDEWQESFEECTEVHLAWACEQADVTLEELGDVLGDDLASMIFGCVFEDFLTWRMEDGRNVVDDYLKRRGWNERVPVKRYMQALRASVMSLYEVSEIERDKGFLARDLVRGGKAVRIHEKRGTHDAKPWDRVAMRVVELGPRLEISGGILPFTPALCAEYMKRFKRLRKRWAADVRETLKKDGTQISGHEFTDGLNEAVLRRSAFIFTALWLDDSFRRVRTLPSLCNTDGHAIAFTTVRFPLLDSAGAEAIRAALNSVREFEREDENAWRWSAFPDQSSKTAGEKAKHTIAGMGDGSISIGSIELGAAALVLHCNSIQRAEKGRALIERAAGQFLKMPVIESKTAEQVMKAPQARSAANTASGLSSAEERAFVQRHLESHYRSVLDEPVPMLGNVTPREAGKTNKGRARLAEWLKVFESNSARIEPGSAMEGYDFSWMWTELGIADLRR